MMKRWKRKRQERRWYRRMNEALYLLARVDSLMKEENWPSYKRKQFWADFIKSPGYRATAFKQIFENLNG